MATWGPIEILTAERGIGPTVTTACCTEHAEIDAALAEMEARRRAEAIAYQIQHANDGYDPRRYLPNGVTVR